MKKMLKVIGTIYGIWTIAFFCYIGIANTAKYVSRGYSPIEADDLALDEATEYYKEFFGIKKD